MVTQRVLPAQIRLRDNAQEALERPVCRAARPEGLAQKASLGLKASLRAFVTAGVNLPP